MLKNVHLKNLALIKEADIDYDKGLNIMTGETGSGKSIIISSINIALGDKANKGLIRTGAPFGLVELTFVSESEKVLNLLDELGISRDERNIIISRKITPESATSKVNGETVTLANVRKITSMLIDVHGQHDHQSLLDPVKHIEIVDKFGAVEIQPLKSELKKCYNAFKELRQKSKDFVMDEDALAKEIAFLNYQKKEIEEAALIAGEDTKLEAEYKNMELSEKLSDSLNSSYNCINGEDSGVVALVGKALAQINYAVNMDPQNEELKLFKSTFTDLDSISRDLGHDLEKYIDSHAFDAERFHKIKERLDTINRLKSKYGNSVDEVIKYADDISNKLKEYSEYSKKKNEIAGQLTKLKGQLNIASSELSKARHKYGEILQERITANLKDLNFLSVDFRVDISKNDKIHENGFDKVEFMISMNPGEAVKPLSKVASGGELSRIMLAIKSSIAENDEIPTLIFDEIDTGISGKTAQMVARKLKSLASTHQIMCITHLPQIAAMADSHFSIHKEVSDGTTISGIEKLSKEAEIEELARLLSGDMITEATLNNARELKEMAKNND